MKNTLRRIDGSLIDEYDDVAACLAKHRHNLHHADLRGMDLRGAHLAGANLTEAELEWVNLREANLTEANLTEANLMGANLMGANIAGANLHNANLENTNLCGVAEKMGIPLDPQLPEKILHQITTHPETWNQEDWHNACGTKHCIAGWTIALSGKLGTYLERNLTTPVAATLLLWRDGYPLPSFHPYASKDECLARLQAMAEGAHACQS